MRYHFVGNCKQNILSLSYHYPEMFNFSKDAENRFLGPLHHNWKTKCQTGGLFSVIHRLIPENNQKFDQEIMLRLKDNSTRRKVSLHCVWSLHTYKNICTFTSWNYWLLGNASICSASHPLPNYFHTSFALSSFVHYLYVVFVRIVLQTFEFVFLRLLLSFYAR